MRKKTLHTHQRDELSRETKLHPVIIDSKTTILVSDNITDDEARTNFLLKAEANRKKHESNYPGRSRNEITKQIKWEQ